MGNNRLKRKPASLSTKASQTALQKNLPFQDDQDYDLMRRGYIATLPNEKIANEKGQIIRDLRDNEFLNNKCPETVHPGLWRNAQLLFPHGLFEVIPGIYQVRGLDLANMTIIRGETGYIVIDALSIVEAAKAGMELVRTHLGELPVVALIYTHSHTDHYGGAKGVINQADVISGKTVVAAPAGFMKEVESEFVIAGPAIKRWAMYQFGSLLAMGPKDAICGGTGPTHQCSTQGTTSIIPPNREITSTGEAMEIDGVHLIFQLTPKTKAPAEMNIYFPEFKALCTAENAYGCMHQLYPLRGAQIRDAKEWADKLTESIRLFGHNTEVLFASHFWPRWGRGLIIDYLTSHRDAYKYIHDQTVRLMNQGFTGTEIAEAIVLPKTLGDRWFSQGNHSTWRQHAKSVYHNYMGWYDGNPAHLNPLPPEEAGKKYVKVMGGSEAVLSKALEAMNNGEYRWAAELVDRVVFSDINNRKAQLLQADILEQLGYQAENATWRNAYLTASVELRHGVANEDKPGMSEDTGNYAIPYLLDVMSVRLLPERAEGKQFKVNLNITDLKEQYVLSLSNSVLIYESGVMDKDADGTLSMDKASLCALLDGRQQVRDLMAKRKLKATGNISFLSGLASLFERPYGVFNLVTP